MSKNQRTEEDFQKLLSSINNIRANSQIETNKAFSRSKSIQ